jgi:hypothetical protein
MHLADAVVTRKIVAYGSARILTLRSIRQRVLTAEILSRNDKWRW